jgi:membrane-associated phospholipid phosphatase
MQALDIALFQILGAGHTPNPWVLAFASHVSTVATWLCVVLVGWIAWRLPSQRLYALLALVAVGVAALAAHALAEAFNMPRPFMTGLSPAHVAHGARGSMPSAHASVMFTLALLFCMRAQLRNVGLALLALAILTGWARVYVGVHFPLDIVGGLLLASVITAAIWLLLVLNRRFVLPVLARKGWVRAT